MLGCPSRVDPVLWLTQTLLIALQGHALAIPRTSGAWSCGTTVKRGTPGSLLVDMCPTNPPAGHSLGMCITLPCPRSGTLLQLGGAQVRAWQHHTQAWGIPWEGIPGVHLCKWRNPGRCSWGFSGPILCCSCFPALKQTDVHCKKAAQIYTIYCHCQRAHPGYLLIL